MRHYSTLRLFSIGWSHQSEAAVTSMPMLTFNTVNDLVIWWHYFTNEVCYMASETIIARRYGQNIAVSVYLIIRWSDWDSSIWSKNCPNNPYRKSLNVRWNPQTMVSFVQPWRRALSYPELVNWELYGLTNGVTNCTRFYLQGLAPRPIRVKSRLS